jgi:diaminohydroxyphosphoribosylaminopyrimidine deaminase/5-amino-6-(5-phosphoribosylamino)uracil reductase
MARALELASAARGRTSPNPMVGAVLVRDGAVVGEGYHARAGEPHAEAVALAQAGERARGADLYVTLEPCAHFGRMPPCTDAIVAAGVARVFAAMRDPNPVVDGRGARRLREAGVSVSFGLLGEKARRLNEAYCKHITTGLPHVTLKIGMSLDGKIATRTGESRWITNEAARRRVHELRDGVDAVLVGIGTILADDPELTTRIPGGDGRNPARVVVDTRLRTPVKARVLSQRPRARVIFVAGPHATEERARELQGLGAEVLRVPGDPQRLDMRAVMERLGAAGIQSVLVEGGSEICASCIESGVVDRAVFFLAPILIGGREAPPAMGGRGAGPLAEAHRLREVRWEALGDNLMIEGVFREGPCSRA